MATITIDLPDDIIDLLKTKAARAKATVSELIEGAAMRELSESGTASWDESLTAEGIAAIEQGLADIQAGRVHAHEDVMADMRNWLAQ